MELFDKTTQKILKLVTVSNATSFLLATNLSNREYRDTICGFVRFADEIVDAILSHNQKF